MGFPRGTRLHWDPAPSGSSGAPGALGISQKNPKGKKSRGDVSGMSLECADLGCRDFGISMGTAPGSFHGGNSRESRSPWGSGQIPPPGSEFWDLGAPAASRGIRNSREGPSAPSPRILRSRERGEVTFLDFRDFFPVTADLIRWIRARKLPEPSKGAAKTLKKGKSLFPLAPRPFQEHGAARSRGQPEFARLRNPRDSAGSGGRGGLRSLWSGPGMPQE